VTIVNDADRGPASAATLVAATLVASVFALAPIEIVRSIRLARVPLAHAAAISDYAHAWLGDLFMTLALGFVVCAYMIVSRILALRLGARLSGWLGPSFSRIAARGWLELGAPAVFLGWLVVRGARVVSASAILPILIAVGLVASAPAIRLLTLGAARIRPVARRHGALTIVMALVLAVLAAWGWAALSGSFGMRYGKSHLVSFGLLVVFLLLVATEVLLALGIRPAFRLIGPAWAAGLVCAGVAFFVSPSAAARELFFLERPTRWFALALARLGPDADADGFQRPLGFSAGQDCDDHDPRKNPGQPELVGNGLDDNCFGGDETRPFEGFISEPSPAHEGAVAASNLLVIILDSFRFDHGSPGGVNEKLTPVIAKLASESLVFDDYRTCSPRTLESFGDLFFGRLIPTFRGAVRVGAIERLTAAGVRTFDISSRFRHEHDNVSGWWKELSVPGTYGDFGDATSVAETGRVLGQVGDQPFFVATHLMGAHEPYEPAPECGGANDAYARYRCALELLDRRVGDMLAAISRSGHTDDTVVAVSADHGEEFGEHGARYHANTVYDEVLHVPLLVRIPKRGHELVRVPIGCFDFLPTLLGAANLRTDAVLVGRDHSRAPRPSDGTQFARTRSLANKSLFEPKTLAVVYRDVKLVVDRQSGLSEYFELASDPEERRPVARVAPDIERALTRRMDGWLSELARQSRPDQRTASVRR
jgi:hypothetical protein